MTKGPSSRLCWDAHSGFTLVEILLALAIAGVVMAAAHELLAVTLRQSDFVWKSEEHRGAAATLAEILDRDLSDIYVPVGEEQALVLSGSPVMASSSKALSFPTASSALGLGQEQEPLVRRVVYRLTPSETRTGRFSLSRSVMPYQSEKVSSQNGLLLTDDLVRFEVAVFDGEKWMAEWPRDDQGGLPRGVRIRFSLADDEHSQFCIVKSFDVSPLAALHLSESAGRVHKPSPEEGP